jgi:pentose-5-phosphate-3-epimerase
MHRVNDYCEYNVTVTDYLLLQMFVDVLTRTTGDAGKASTTIRVEGGVNQDNWRCWQSTTIRVDGGVNQDNWRCWQSTTIRERRLVITSPCFHVHEDTD